MELNDAPNIGCNAEALEHIQTVRQMVYTHPHLARGETKPCPKDSKHAKGEWERRSFERTKMGELSRYYQLSGNGLAAVREGEGGNGKQGMKEGWKRPLLLKEGEHGCDH